MGNKLEFCASVVLLWASSAVGEDQTTLPGGEPYRWRRLSTNGSNTVMPTTQYTDADFPVFRGKNRNFFCEVCQSAIWVVQTAMRERLPTKKSELGSVDEALEEILDSGLCNLDEQWESVAEHTEVYTSEDLQHFCNGMVEQDEFAFGDAMAMGKNQTATATKLCVTELGACETADLWGAGDFPDEREAKSDRNKALSNSFLEVNAQREGVRQTPSGLQYEIIREGGESLGDDTKLVRIIYNATLVNGASFDLSSNWGESLVIDMDEAVVGVNEAIKLSGVGGEVVVALPPDLAYGEGGAGRLVGPNSAVLYRLRVLEVVERRDSTSTSTTTSGDESSEEEVDKVEDDDDDIRVETGEDFGTEESDDDDGFLDSLPTFEGPAVLRRRDEL